MPFEQFFLCVIGHPLRLQQCLLQSEFGKYSTSSYTCTILGTRVYGSWAESSMHCCHLPQGKSDSSAAVKAIDVSPYPMLASR